MPDYGFFGQFDGHMRRELVVSDSGILLDIKKTEQPLAHVLPFSGNEDDVFSC
jgi:hypothetical protein